MYDGYISAIFAEEESMARKGPPGIKKTSSSLRRSKTPQYYRFPTETKRSNTELIMIMFKRVPKTEEELKQHQKNVARVPGLVSSNKKDTWMKTITVKVQDRVLTGMKYMHCEIAFNNSMFTGGTKDESKAIAYYVTAFDREGNPGTVSKMERTFMSNQYKDRIILEVPRKKAFLAAEYCEKQMGKPFDDNGSRGIYWIADEFNESKFFCVSLTVAALQHSKIISGYDPMKTTVDQLYSIVKRHPLRSDTALVPYEKEKVKKVLGAMKSSHLGRRDTPHGMGAGHGSRISSSLSSSPYSSYSKERKMKCTTRVTPNASKVSYRASKKSTTTRSTTPSHYRRKEEPSGRKRGH